MSEVKLDELSCTKIKLYDTQIKNIEYQAKELCREVMEKRAEIIKTFLEPLGGSFEGWDIDVDKCKATKKRHLEEVKNADSAK